jgi:hypothetical protein
MEAVAPVDVGPAGWAEHGPIPFRPSDAGCGVRGRILGPDIGFHFHHDAHDLLALQNGS